MKTFVLFFASTTVVFVLFCYQVPGDSIGETIRRDSLKITLAMERETYSVQDRYVLSITVENAGPAVIEIPDPFYEHDKHFWYHIEGPGKEGMTNHDYMSEGREYFRMRPMRPEFEEKRLMLKPGERVSGDIPLASAIGPFGPGQYHVAAELEWEGQRTRSNVLIFVLHEQK